MLRKDAIRLSQTLAQAFKKKVSGLLLDPADLFIYSPDYTSSSKDTDTRVCRFKDRCIYAPGFLSSEWAKKREGFQHIAKLSEEEVWDGLKTFVV